MFVPTKELGFRNDQPRFIGEYAKLMRTIPQDTVTEGFKRRTVLTHETIFETSDFSLDTSKVSRFRASRARLVPSLRTCWFAGWRGALVAVMTRDEIESCFQFRPGRGQN